MDCEDVFTLGLVREVDEENLVEAAFSDQFGRKLREKDQFEVESYLRYRGNQFVDRFDANSYLYITKAMDYWDLPARYGSLEAALARSRASYLVLSFTSDWLYPTSESVVIAEAARRAGRPVEHVEIESTAGHDAFLVDYAPQAPLVEEFLATLSASL